MNSTNSVRKSLISLATTADLQGVSERIDAGKNISSVCMEEKRVLLDVSLALTINDENLLYFSEYQHSRNRGI